MIARVRLLRRLLSVLLVLAFAVLLPAALATSWVDRTVADTDGYVDAVAPLADDEVVQEAVTSRVRAAVVAAVDLPPGVGDAVLAEAVSLAVRRVVASNTFPPLWRASNEVAHRSLVDVLAQPRGAGGEVSIDVTPVVEAAVDQLPGRLLAGRVDVPTASFAVAGSGEVDQARRAYQAVEGRGTVLPVVAAVALVLALVVSPLRRRTTLLAAALALPALGLLAVALLAGRQVVETGTGSRSDEEQELVLAVWDSLVSGLWFTTAVAAGTALLTLLVVAVLPRRRPMA